MLILSLLLMLVTAPIYAANTGSGFGGSGFISEDPTSGFGGTGRASSGFGGTGVIGTITEFGSIWVNGIEIGYGQKTQVTSDLNTDMTTQATAKEVLKLGQQVILETLANDNKALTKAIHLYYPLAGRVTAVQKNSVEINGQYRVQTNNNTHYDRNLTLKIGAFIAVNGYQTDKGLWQATRISLNPQNRSLYQPRPSKGFSDAIKQVVIESSLHQMTQWKMLSSVSTINSKPSERMVINGQWLNGEIIKPNLTPYRDFVGNLMQKQPVMGDRPENRHLPEQMGTMNSLHRERLSMQKEQLEMMQMQREQKAMIQDQMDQIHQIQEFKDQFEQMRR